MSTHSTTPSHNPLASIPEKARKTIYAVYAIAGLLVGSIQVGFSADPGADPAWVNILLSIFAYLGLAIGATAISNMPAVQDVVSETGKPLPRDEYGAITSNTVWMILGIIGLVLIVLLFVGAI